MRSRVILVGAVLVLASSAAAFARGGTQPNPAGMQDFLRAKFDRSATVTNQWLPLRPGTRYVFEGSTSEGAKRVPHRLVYTVTDLVKVIAGVRNAVVWDRDFTAGELAEAELSFYAQDNDGNVWHTGEYPEEYEHGKFVKAPAWIAGVKGAWAGIEMMATPRLGMPSYSQGYAPPPVNWTDHAKVRKVSEKTCVPFRCYKNLLVLAEYNPGEPGVYQVKYYARGLGNVRVDWLGAKDDSKEVLKLVDVIHLGAAGRAEARAQALKLERRAYKIKKDVYGNTPPARALSGTGP
jgi:hypothetical protein